jgi:hypothetical protein
MTDIDEILALVPPGFDVQEWIEERIRADLPQAMWVHMRGDR